MTEGLVLATKRTDPRGQDSVLKRGKAYRGVETDPAALLHLPHKPHITQGYTSCARTSCIQ